MTPVVVVTGAAGGIGSVTCDVLERYGWKVIAMDRRPVERAGALQVDLADAPAVASALTAIPQVDALVNNAAVQLYKPLLDTTVEEWDAVAAVNIRAAFACLKAVHRQLGEVHGSVVNVASVHATATSHSIAAYAATKGGLVAFTRAAALEMAPLGVRVNAVLPGAVGIEVDQDEAPTFGGPVQPLRHPNKFDIAKALIFFVSDLADGVSGQALAVDGGASIKSPWSMPVPGPATGAPA
jgi:NAD(P)-dependent dehydrogenase (short-subunit alcohol dehydrogenase family)